MTSRREARGAATRRRLIEAAVDLFGVHGFDGVSTRRLADAAGVNLAAIPYHFGGKEGLYRAAAEHIAEEVSSRLAAHGGDPAALEENRLSVDAARAALKRLLHQFCAVIVGSSEAAKWARFVIREQMAPTPAFDLLYGKIARGPLASLTRLVAILLDRPETDEEIRLRAFMLVGQVLVFRTAREAALRWLDWDEIGAPEQDAILAALDTHIDAIFERPAR